MHHAWKIHFSPVSSYALVSFVVHRRDVSMGSEEERNGWQRGKAHLRPFVSTRPTIKVRQETQGLTPHASPCILTHRYAGTYTSTLQAYPLFLKANLRLTVLSARCSSIKSAHRPSLRTWRLLCLHTPAVPHLDDIILVYHTVHCPNSPEPGLF
jgi:hypothetical protein